MGYLPYQLVQVFVHQPYLLILCLSQEQNVSDAFRHSRSDLHAQLAENTQVESDLSGGKKSNSGEIPWKRGS